ncbi:Inner membrane protein YqjA [Corynebacterium kalinowskii]|uniref:Inner membrane protein YqjA n=1 Tax=Corynebacterium kalinowskii TaxID=2675216 RepID=A0A6B8VJK1_9CORY|nr:DedA family protein [Corynebacterium kalinowskii]QGU03229.1 Inner membrane protein YqjA [Corynebacterium kalinowskii]
MSLSTLLDAGTLLQGFGPWALAGLAIVVFIESGVLFPFLPGDSLLVTAAILRHDLGIRVFLLILVGALAAIAGDQVGFWLGRRYGRGLFKKDARILKLDHLHQAEAFFAKHGSFALVLGRFVPIVRTYVPLAAGTADMTYRKFLGWNVLGAIGWVVSMTLIGVLLGDIPGIAHRIDAIMLVIVGLSVLPIIMSASVKWLKARA